MELSDFMQANEDYYLGGLSVLTDDVSEGALHQMRIDTIEYLSEPENLRMIAPPGTPALDFDAHDILNWLLIKGKL